MPRRVGESAWLVHPSTSVRAWQINVGSDLLTPWEWIGDRLFARRSLRSEAAVAFPRQVESS